MAEPDQQGMGAGRIIVIVAGSIFALIGIGVAIAGGSLLALFGGDSTVASGSHPFSTPSTALVSKAADIKNTSDLARVIGDPKVQVTMVAANPSATGVFVGIGPARAVEHYLAGAPIDEVTDLEVDPFVLKRKARPGTKKLAPPTDQLFWVARATGRSKASLLWKISDGDYRIVVMNADGSRNVKTNGSIGFEVPHARTIAWALIGAGLLILLLAGTAIVVAIMTRRRE